MESGQFETLKSVMASSTVDGFGEKCQFELFGFCLLRRDMGARERELCIGGKERDVCSGRTGRERRG